MTKTHAPAGLGELSRLLASWRLHLEAANLSPRTIRPYTDDGALLAKFLTAKGMPTVASNIRREHVEASIAAELERTAPASAATRYRSLQQLFNWLEAEGEITASPMAKMRPGRVLLTLRNPPKSTRTPRASAPIAGICAMRVR